MPRWNACIRKIGLIALGIALSPAVSPLAAAAPPVAPKPLFRDPIFDGTADPSVIFDRASGTWKMFYTNRRATMRLPDPNDVAWVHGTKIGIAVSKDGQHWTYAGTADLPASCTSTTSWAPELYYEAGVYHMWLTVVPGIFHRWGAPGATGRITHLTSTNLSVWQCAGDVETSSDRIIDPTILKLASGKYRMWFKDERYASRIVAADSTDLKHWEPVGDGPITQMKGEGPKAFRFKGYYWIIADAWKGLMVLRSEDALHWSQQPGFLLERPGKNPTDRAIGQHAAIVVNDGRAYLFYFVHQTNEPEAKADPYWHQRTVIQVAELRYRDGSLFVDRDEKLRYALQPPR